MNRQIPSFKMGYALSGGGTRGIAHLGMLEYIESQGLKPDLISGCSAGSIVACLYAVGYRPKEILSIIKSYKITKLIGFRWSTGGLTNLSGLRKELEKLIPYQRMEDLPIPVCIVVTELCSGKWEAYQKGDLIDLVIASCSLPFIFEPLRMGDKLFVDGGVLKNLPAEPIRDQCQYLIGFNVLPRIESDIHNLSSITKSSIRSMELAVRSNNVIDKKYCDLVIEPMRVGHYGLFQFSKADDIFNIGYREAEKHKTELLKLLKAIS